MSGEFLTHFNINCLIKLNFSLVFAVVIVLKASLSTLINGESMTIPQLVQIWINADHMEKSIGSLETFIAKTTK